MHLRVLLLFLAALLCLPPLLHGAVGAADPWLEMEKGLQLCGVEINCYRSCCFISREERERLISAGAVPLNIDPQAVPDCRCSMRDGWANDEILLEIYGADRGACSRLWRQFAAIAEGPAGAADRVWCVEGSHEAGGELTALGEALIRALGGQLRRVDTHPRMVQLLAELPWAGAGFALDEGPVNLTLELYEDAYLERVRIRLGIPVLFSFSNG
ncbi:MAG: hypothetical protein GX883_02325 [Firmicutes bacterium]|nr:hypothetical protein [Bacillota bacterium]